MSSFRATLELGGKEYDVLYSNYEFSRTTDKKGRACIEVSLVIVSASLSSLLMTLLHRGYAQQSVQTC